MGKPDLDTTRERPLHQIFAASTLAEVAAAKQALRDWLAHHPDEPGMADAFEVLSHQEEFARAQGVETVALTSGKAGRRRR